MTTSEASRPRRRRGDLAPNPRMWEALRHGDGLTAILTDFYTRVYADPRLAPFFHGVTRQRAIEKQWNFLCEVFTGQRVYFGDRPRNAHHWMVISDELFDHREALMEQCLRRYGLPEDLVEAWRAVEETFRSHIVKDRPFARKVGGVAMPLEGHEAVTLTVGSLCDACGAELPPGSVVTTHVRTGRTVCGACAVAEEKSP